MGLRGTGAATPGGQSATGTHGKTGNAIFTVSRTLKGWEGQGIVEGGRERVIIRRPDDLLAIAEDLPQG